MHDYGIYIGRFQPLHIGHQHVIEEALTKVKTLIIVVGSANKARNPVNPFTYQERYDMLHMVYCHEINMGRILVMGMYDYPDNQDWADHLANSVEQMIRAHDPNLEEPEVALAGFGKDKSSFYLDMFPCWESIQIDAQHGTINASDIRHSYLRRLPRFADDAVHHRVGAWMRGFALSAEFKELVEEAEYYRAYPSQYGRGPFLTADAVVLHRGKVLLVTRGKTPGKGLMAMPGGFVNSDERLDDAIYRELEEETLFTRELMEPYHYGVNFLADDPKRSLRGRVVSHIGLFLVPDDVELPTPVGSDDAVHAGWYSFDEIYAYEMFEDHYDLLDHILDFADVILTEETEDA